MKTSLRDFSILLRVALSACLASPLFAGDFNGDGRADLAIAVDLDVGGGNYRGAVEILFANAGGLSSSGLEIVFEAVTQTVGSDHDASFGDAIAIGDFDGDGFDDLAVGAPYAPVDGIVGAGLVSIFRGYAGGLTPHTLLHQNNPGMKDNCEANERFGTALAAGDFNGDGFDDLAIGVLETVSGKKNAGAVHIVYGSKNGLTEKGDQIWTQNSSGIDDSAETNDAFGSALASGDVDADGRDDLVIAIPGEVRNHKGLSVTGSVAVLHGGKKGLTSKKDLIFDAFALYGKDADADSNFGAALAVGDFFGNSKAEIAVGCPGWDIDFPGSDDGAAFILPLKGSKLDLEHGQPLGTSASGRTGSSFAVGDFNGDARADLAIGMPLCGKYTGVKYAGSVVVFNGMDDGLDIFHAQVITRDTPGVLGAPGVAANFGLSLAGADFNADGKSDLVISSPYDSIGSASYCGSINVLLGTSAGVTGTNSQYWSQGAFGLLSSYQMFGLALGS